MLLQIASAVLIGIGVFALYTVFTTKKGDRQSFLVILAALLLMAAGGWLMLSFIDIWMIIKKIAGLLLALTGFFLAFKFPASYLQLKGYTTFAVVAGLIMLVLGIFMLLF